MISTLQWRHNERSRVSNHRRLDGLLNRLPWWRSNKIPKLHVTGLCEGNLSVTEEFPSQRVSDAENVSIWWRHLDYHKFQLWKFPLVFRMTHEVKHTKIQSTSAHWLVQKCPIHLGQGTKWTLKKEFEDIVTMHGNCNHILQHSLITLK